MAITQLTKCTFIRNMSLQSIRSILVVVGYKNFVRLQSNGTCIASESVCQPPSFTTNFVPPNSPPEETVIQALKDFLLSNSRVLVLTGAGVSTESGIPDYRSEGVGLYARSTNRPVQYQDFLKSAAIRQRYWARNSIGWPKFSSCSPNTNHIIFKQWEDIGKVHWLVTQNVDALHYKAGSKNVTELHGSAHRVICLDCDMKMARFQLQKMIQRYNPNWSAQAVDIAPDGDVQISQEQVQGFQVPSCPNCGGILKPEIVFFGDNVAKTTVDFVYNKLEESDSILVAGSSLQVISGFRFVNAAKEQRKPIAIINIGPTRADKIADLKIDAKCSDVIRNIDLTS